MNLTNTNLNSTEVKEQLDLHEKEYFVSEPTYEILNQIEEKNLRVELWKKNGDINGIEFTFPVFELWEILTIEHVEHANLISAIHNNFRSELEESFLINHFDVEYIPEKYRINETKDFHVYAEHPFIRTVKISIKPIVVKWVKSSRYIKYFTIGYILWQVIKVYKDIFLYNQKKLLGNNGYTFGQLVLGSLSLLKTNTGYIEFQH